LPAVAAADTPAAAAAAAATPLRVVTVSDVAVSDVTVTDGQRQKLMANSKNPSSNWSPRDKMEEEVSVFVTRLLQSNVFFSSSVLTLCCSFSQTY
jgi:hypothetical protein